MLRSLLGTQKVYLPRVLTVSKKNRPARGCWATSELWAFMSFPHHSPEGLEHFHHYYLMAWCLKNIQKGDKILRNSHRSGVVVKFCHRWESRWRISCLTSGEAPRTTFPIYLDATSDAKVHSSCPRSRSADGIISLLSFLCRTLPHTQELLAGLAHPIRSCWPSRNCMTFRKSDAPPLE